MSASLGLFAKYPNEVFIETGSGSGEGIDQAIKAGFKTIYSIELSEYMFNIVVNRFSSFKSVNLIFGDSKDWLGKLLERIDQKVTFWLDAHASGGMTVGDVLPPLFEELDIIAKHSIKEHTILIDDLRCWNWTENLKERIKLINLNYEFTLEDGFYQNDVLAAKVV